mgnify:FL=1
MRFRPIVKAQDPPAGRVNFWTPTPWSLRLDVGSRFGFLLKAPIRKIGGFGHLVEYEELSVRDAWDRWGPANGVPTLEDLEKRIREFAGRRSLVPLPDSGPSIGCIVLEDCVFLDGDSQIAPEALGLSFPPQIVKWKRFAGELILPIEAEFPPASSAFTLVDDPHDDWELARRRKRVAQPLFRREVIAAYEGKCALTATDCEEALDAAHIQPFRGPKSHHVQNGIALRRDIHRLFDAGLIAFNADGTVVLSSRLQSTSYGALAGGRANFPRLTNQRPSFDALAFHRAKVFRG